MRAEAAPIACYKLAVEKLCRQPCGCALGA